MTSGEFELIPLASIIVHRDERQRKTLSGIDELRDSIAANGLLHPIVVTRDRVLVAGERRFTAVTQLGWTDIPVQWVDAVDPIDLHVLELEENVKRVDLSWQERVAATAAYYELQKTRNPDTTQEAVAKQLNVDERHFGRLLSVAEGIKADPELAKLEKLTTAINAVSRKQERAKTSALRELEETFAAPAPAPVAASEGEAPVTPVVPAAPKRYAQLLNADFLEWSQSPLADPFNFLHVDFPYGKNTGDKRGFSGAKLRGSYADSADVYLNLLGALTERQDNFCATQAHMMFWLHMDYYAETKAALEDAGWRVAPYPLIWGKSDNTGIIPDPNRSPRQTYEAALFCTRGDRKIVKSVANIFWGPVTKEFHTSEKSYNMLSHFFRMLVDESSRVLDPTCGSGMAIRAAEDAGAQFSLGLERDLDFYTAACDNLKL